MTEKVNPSKLKNPLIILLIATVLLCSSCFICSIIIYATASPSFDLENPKENNSTTNNSSFQIKFHCIKINAVKLNDKEVKTSDICFGKYNITLTEGENKFVAIAVDEKNNSHQLEFTIKYEPKQAVQPTEKHETPTSTASLTSEPNSTTVSYEIVKIEDLSRKAMTKLLSEYTTAEIEALPMVNKKLYNIVIDPKVKQEQIKPTLDKAISEITTKDKDIDELILFFFSDKQIVGQGYDIAKAVWAFKGELGKVTPEIVVSNSRIGYSTTYDIKPGIEQYLANRNKEATLYGLTTTQRQQVFKELYASEGRAQKESDQLYPITNRENISKNTEKFEELSTKYAEEIYRKWNITKEDALKIAVEALEKNWSNK